MIALNVERFLTKFLKKDQNLPNQAMPTKANSYAEILMWKFSLGIQILLEPVSTTVLCASASYERWRF